MSTLVKNDGVVFYEGAIIEATKYAEMLPSGRVCRIVRLIWTKQGQCKIGIYYPESYETMHDLDGELPSYTGYWLERQHLNTAFIMYEMKLTITGSFTHRGKEMQGKKGKYLCPIDNRAKMHILGATLYTPDQIVVEMEENVGGTGCDGLGKSGHCVIVPKNAVTYAKPSLAEQLQI
jgi:hypothetical protein